MIFHHRTLAERQLVDLARHDWKRAPREKPNESLSIHCASHLRSYFHNYTGQLPARTDRARSIVAIRYSTYLSAQTALIANC